MFLKEKNLIYKIEKKRRLTLLGAIIGDIIGSVYEFHNIKYKQFELFSKESKFTDDTVLTVAVADSILHSKSYGQTILEYARRYPNETYGNGFRLWFESEDPKPYNSFGNGAAMRVSPIGFAFQDLKNVLLEAKKSAEITHNHPEGIKGAQAVASAIFLAKTGKSKQEIKEYIETTFKYYLKDTINQIRPRYAYTEEAIGCVPEAIRAFIDSTDYEDAIRNAISIGGDADTLACICGGISQAFYKKIPSIIREKALEYLPEEFKKIIFEFENKFLKNIF
jgi:ADP-ribosylglycohydrolase